MEAEQDVSLNSLATAAAAENCSGAADKTSKEPSGQGYSRRLGRQAICLLAARATMQLNTQAFHGGCASSQLNQGVNIFSAQEVWLPSKLNFRLKDQVLQGGRASSQFDQEPCTFC